MPLIAKSTMPNGGVSSPIINVRIMMIPKKTLSYPYAAATGATNRSTAAGVAIGLLQAGLVLSLEPVLARWLQRPRAWSATVLLNTRIMTLYLWHLTAMVLAGRETVPPRSARAEVLVSVKARRAYVPIRE